MPKIIPSGRRVLFRSGGVGGWVSGWVGGVEKLILKLTSASTGVEVEAWAELGNNLDFYSF